MPFRVLPFGVPTVASALLGAACATHPAPVTWTELAPEQREAIFLTQLGHGMETCPIHPDHYDLPRAVPASIDTVAILDRLSGREGPGGAVLVSVSMDTVAVRTLRPLESDFDEATTGALLDKVRAHLRPPDSGRWTGRLLIDAGDPPSVRAGYGLECAPLLTNRSEIDTALEHLVRRLPETAFPVTYDSDGNVRAGRRSLIAWFRVGEDGRVKEAQVRRSSGDPRVDAVVEEIAPIPRFRPAMLDGVPVAVWVQFPLTLQR